MNKWANDAKPGEMIVAGVAIGLVLCAAVSTLARFLLR